MTRTVPHIGPRFLPTLRRARFMAALTVGLALMLHAIGQGTAVQKLTLEQIEGLIAHGVPDATMSTQIQAHGLTFTPTQATLDELRAKGAGPLTLAKVAARISAVGSGESSAPVPARRTKITRAQLEQALRGHSQDSVLAEQIRLRGIGFPVTSPTLDQLASRGAGPGTLAALREQMRVGKLEIQTAPGTRLLLDGNDLGQAGQDGALQVPEVIEGDHNVTARADGYQEASLSFSLAKDEYKKLNMTLQWAGGYISLGVLPRNAVVNVAGPRPFTGALTRFQAPPGDYTATFSLDGFRPQTRSFHVAAGETHTETVSLEIDPAVAAALLSGAQDKLASGDVGGAIQDLHKVLNISPADGHAEALLAEASFQNGDSAGFLSAGTQALASGQTVSVVVQHVHNFPHQMIHPVTLAISRSGIAITSTPPVEGCKMPDSLAYNLISTADVETDPYSNHPGSVELYIKYLSSPPEKHSFMKVLHTVSFGAPGSVIDKSAPAGMPALASSPGGIELLRAVGNLIKRAQRGI